MITNHTYNKARRAASQGGWGERASGKKGGKKRKPRGALANWMTFPRHGTLRTVVTFQPELFQRLKQLLDYSAARGRTTQHHELPPELSADKPQIVITSPIVNET